MPGRRSAVVGTLVAAACAATTLTACTSSGPPPARSVPAVDRVGSTLFTASQRRQVPPLAGRTIRGTSLQLAGLTGHGVVVLNVWASWCSPCRAESRTLAEMSRSLATRGVRFVGIDEQDGAAKARAFAARVGEQYPSLSDPSGRMLAQLTELPSGGIPSTLVIDRKGLIAGRVIGAVHEAALSRLIARIDSGR